MHMTARQTLETRPLVAPKAPRVGQEPSSKIERPRHRITSAPGRIMNLLWQHVAVHLQQFIANQLMDFRYAHLARINASVSIFGVQESESTSSADSCKVLTKKFRMCTSKLHRNSEPLHAFETATDSSIRSRRCMFAAAQRANSFHNPYQILKLGVLACRFC